MNNLKDKLCEQLWAQIPAQVFGDVVWRVRGQIPMRAFGQVRNHMQRTVDEKP